jgi:hypothetical protein
VNEVWKKLHPERKAPASIAAMRRKVAEAEVMPYGCHADLNNSLLSDCQEEEQMKNALEGLLTLAAALLLAYFSHQLMAQARRELGI